MAGKLLFRNGKLTFRNSNLVFVEEGDSDECECCGEVCACCTDRIVRMLITIAGVTVGPNPQTCIDEAPLDCTEGNGTFDIPASNLANCTGSTTFSAVFCFDETFNYTVSWLIQCFEIEDVKTIILTVTVGGSAGGATFIKEVVVDDIPDDCSVLEGSIPLDSATTPDWCDFTAATCSVNIIAA